ncbi:hypothetical protein O7627_26780 [Solwaraspora sp. WMMD1047]|uniref:hypothetical protein n=1 Tax=Solwaraspora sp. WMMD1047 TaxID=3016102 RepID=UPI002416AD27|nr:hypothetical protein [Solwaraspora sp. WMMD1047]MDG4832884.1 hypothetical protein [Solwaraspora sp. WMMD1047]
MTETTYVTDRTRPPAAETWWTERVGYLAAGWAALYGALALVWTITGDGYPFAHDLSHGVSLLRVLPVGVGAPLFAAVLLTTAAAALAMAGPLAVRPPGILRTLLLGYGWLVAAALLLVVPDYEVLAVAGYAPMLLLSVPLGWPVEYAEVFDWTLANKVFAVFGGVLLARAVLTWQLRTAPACPWCGRRAGGASWTSAASAARWGRWAVVVAAIIPVLYSITRFAWLAGIPLGISADSLAELQESGAVWAGAGLGAFGVVGAVLTVGLVRPWGERFPRWMIGLAGRRVPVKLAVVPASLVAVAVTAAGLALLSQPLLWDGLTSFNLSIMPMALWPVWGIALGAAALAYHLRRRGGCARCGRAG